LFRHLTDVLIAWGPLGILFLAVLDSSGVPVAGVFDALLILIAVKRPEVAWLCAGLAVLGSTVGNTVLYWMAHQGGRRFMEKAAPGGRALRFQSWFRRYGMVTVFVPALVPIPMPLKLFVISAGVLGTSRGEFIGVVLLARFLRYFGEAWLGIRLGQESSKFVTSHALDFLAGAVLLAIALYGFILWRDRRVPNDHTL
jgi:membrane protein YqaA with SNARE-associated domain